MAESSTTKTDRLKAIEVRGLTKVYRTYKKRPGFWGAVRDLLSREYEDTAAASDITFSIEPGELVGFLGPNGAGKTTTLKMLSGLLYPTRGEAHVLGYVPWQRKSDFKRSFSLVMGQKNQLWWDLPAAESLELNRVIYGLDRKEAQRTIDELTEMLDVRHKLNVMVRELSLGERMKMELIAALLHKPRVLFLDEPTIGLDVVSQQKVRNFLRDYPPKVGMSTILTSHYMQDIEALCHRVIIIDQGKIQFDGPLQQILDRFSKYKIITVTSSREMNETLPAGWGEVLETNGATIKFKVQRDRVADVCQEIFSRYKVEDINIQEVPIEEIIRQVFSSHAS